MFHVCMGVFTIFTDNSAYFVTVLCSDLKLLRMSDSRWSLLTLFTSLDNQSVDECCKAISTTVLGLGRGSGHRSTHLFCLQSAAVWVVAVKQHFAEHTREGSNCSKLLQYWPGCLSNCCSVGKKRYRRLPPKHEGVKELNGPCPGRSVLR